MIFQLFYHLNLFWSFLLLLKEPFLLLKQKLSRQQKLVGVLISLLNNYFEEMNKIIVENGGEIDKLIGDNIMATFDIPDNAIKSAIEMKRKLKLFNESGKDRF